MKRLIHRALRLSLFALVLAPLTGSRLAAQRHDATGTVTPDGDISALLLECMQQNRKECATKLVALGFERIPELFEVFADGRFPVRIGERGNSHRPLSRAQTTAVLEALGRLPRAQLLAFFQALAAAEDPGPSEKQRAKALDTLGLVGSPSDLPLLVLFGQAAPGERRPAKTVRNAFGSALERLVERDPATLSRVPGSFGSAHPALYLPMIEAVSAAASTERLATLAELLGKEPRVDTLLLAEIGRMGTALTHPLDERVKAEVRRYLIHDDPQLLVEAVLALQALEDQVSLPVLIGLVEHESVNVRSKTLTALRALTGRQFPPDAERWSLWYDREMTWWETKAQEDFRLIRSGAPSQASRLVLELSKKRFFRHELSAPIAHALERREIDLVVMTCAALGHLGSSRSVPPLVACLENEKEDVRAAAWRALQRITGSDLGPDPEPWKALARAQEARSQ